MIKLVIADCDGTIITSEKTVTDRTKKTIEKLRAKGIIFAIATGRFKEGARVVLDMLGLKAEEIAAAYDNGSHIEINNVKHFEDSIDVDMIRRIKTALKDIKCRIVLYSQKNWFVEERDEWYERVDEFYPGKGVVRQFEPLLPELEGEPIKVVVRADEKEMMRIIGVLSEKFGNLRFFLSHKNILEIQKNHIGKGSALKKIAEYYKIDLKNTMSFGDYDNDADMLECAGIGVAMANASEAAKKVADYVTLSNDEDGFAAAVEKFVFGK